MTDELLDEVVAAGASETHDLDCRIVHEFVGMVMERRERVHSVSDSLGPLGPSGVQVHEHHNPAPFTVQVPDRIDRKSVV